MRMPMNTAFRLVDMPPARGKSFSVEENARIREGARALLERAGSQAALAETLGVSQPTLSNFIRAEHPTGAGPRLGDAIARELGITLDELRTGQRRAPAGAPIFGAIPGWAEAEAEARRIYGKRLPSYAWESGRRLMGAQAPAVLNAVTVFNLVQAYWEMMSDETRAEAIRRQAEEEMKREDAEADELLRARHDAREAGRPVPPMPDDPASIVPRKHTGPSRAVTKNVKKS